MADISDSKPVLTRLITFVICSLLGQCIDFADGLTDILPDGIWRREVGPGVTYKFLVGSGFHVPVVLIKPLLLLAGSLAS